jgi:protein O-mannosyl-transferase
VRTAPFFAVGAVLVPVNMWFQARITEDWIGTGSFIQHLLGAGAVVWFYLSKAILPVNLIFVYPQWHIQTNQLRRWLPLAATLIATGVLWQHRRGWSRPLLLAWAYFCVALAPVWGFTQVGFMRHSLVADHYQHIALIGVTTLAAAGWGTWRARTRGAAAWAANATRSRS